VNIDGITIGTTIEEQTYCIIENCKRQLSQANYVLKDVFKVNVYLTDLASWPAFNKIYIAYLYEQ